MECGIVGLPNVGKSTFFNALTATADAQAANYPFCTIEPNVGTVCVPDARLAVLAKQAKSSTIIPTQLTFVDIAGLVRGASQGEGLGNQFLSHIRKVDAILHVVRCFEDENVVHVSGVGHPLEDIAIVETELMLADLQSVENRLDRKKKDELFPLLQKAHQVLSQGKFARTALWEPQEQALFKRLDLLTLKPMVYVCNVAENRANPSWVAQVQAHGEKTHHVALPLCNQLEAELAPLLEEERSAYLRVLGMEETGLSQIVRAVAQELGLISFFTVGPKEARAWTLSKGATALDAAGVIHTDFQKGFIRAEVIHYLDYVTYGPAKIKEEGKLRLEGREYPVQDGDVMHFRFNV